MSKSLGMGIIISSIMLASCSGEKSAGAGSSSSNTSSKPSESSSATV